MSQQWNPLRDLVHLQDRMNRLFEDATERRAKESEAAGDEIERVDWYPAADVYESDGEYTVAVDLPGVERSTLDIGVDENRLTIKGRRSDEITPIHLAERPKGRFLKSFGMPASVDQQKIQADYRDGVLQVHLPKLQEQKAARVKIEVS